MNKTFRQLEKDFTAARDIQEDWEILKRELSSCYYTLAGIELHMNYYNLPGRWHRDEGRPEADRLFGAGELRRRLEDCIAASYDGQNQNEAVKELEDIRREIISRMKAVLSYSDSFQLYEYVLNRLAPAFEESLEDIDNDDMARRILNEIFAGNDNLLINENIKLMVLSLPIRMTRRRFTDILRESLSEYVGSPYDSFDKLMYLVRSSSGINEPEGSPEYFGELSAVYNEFRQADFQNMTRERHDSLAEKLKAVVRVIIDGVEIFRALEEIANELLVMAYTRADASEEALLEAGGLRGVYDEAYESFGSGQGGEMSEAVKALFESIEGRLEYYIENMQRFELLLDKAGMIDVIRECGEFVKLDRCRKLMSDSLFVELEDEARRTPLEGEEFEKLFDRLAADLDAAFRNDSRLLMRARMAFVLNQLPVFFRSRTEVMNYVRNALDSCHDVAEKLVSVRMLLDGIARDDE